MHATSKTRFSPRSKKRKNGFVFLICFSEVFSRLELSLYESMYIPRIMRRKRVFYVEINWAEFEIERREFFPHGESVVDEKHFGN